MKRNIGAGNQILDVRLVNRRDNSSVWLGWVLANLLFRYSTGRHLASRSRLGFG